MLQHEPVDLIRRPREAGWVPSAVPAQRGPTGVDAAPTALGQPDRMHHGVGVYQRLGKPALDVVAAAVLLVLTLPLMLLAAAAVLIALGRPIILRQDRVGRDGKVFTVWKFRSMRPCRRRRPDRRGGDGFLGRGANGDRRRLDDRRCTHKHPHDPRLVTVGRFLRKWSIDELPQLFNVLRGDMSLVGPRPEMLFIVSRYEPWQHHRHVVKPGITGLWQVSDRGQDGKLMHERTDVDLRYVNSLSFMLDVKLLFLTIPAALGYRRGI